MDRSTAACKQTKQRGTSLIEVMLALGVATALATTGVPALSSALEQQRLSSTTQELISAVQFARSEAITRNGRIVMAAKTPGRWTDGWHVFVDTNDDGQLGEEEISLREWTPAADGLKISAHFGAAHSGSALSFTPIGAVRRPGSDGLVLGRIALTAGTKSRALCFSSLTMRVVASPSCARA